VRYDKLLFLLQDIERMERTDPDKRHMDEYERRRTQAIYDYDDGKDPDPQPLQHNSLFPIANGPEDAMYGCGDCPFGGAGPPIDVDPKKLPENWRDVMKDVWSVETEGVGAPQIGGPPIPFDTDWTA
jgi:hypothetical protein